MIGFLKRTKGPTFSVEIKTKTHKEKVSTLKKNRKEKHNSKDLQDRLQPGESLRDRKFEFL